MFPSLGPVVNIIIQKNPTNRIAVVSIHYNTVKIYNMYYK